MVRRLLCLTVLLASLCATACGETKSSTPKKVDDPDANPVPKAGGVKGG